MLNGLNCQPLAGLLILNDEFQLLIRTRHFLPYRLRPTSAYRDNKLAPRWVNGLAFEWRQKVLRSVANGRFGCCHRLNGFHALQELFIQALHAVSVLLPHDTLFVFAGPVCS